MNDAKTKAEARRMVDALNMQWAEALKSADDAAEADDADGYAARKARADAILAEMERVEALIPDLPSALVVACNATTADGKEIVLPRGTTVETSRVEVMRYAAKNPRAATMSVTGRHPRARKPQQYTIPLDEMILAVVS